VIDVAMLSVIRRWYYREGKGIREIARRTGLSRNTVKKYVSEERAPVYKKRCSSSRLDAFSGTLSAWLEAESQKGRKQRRTVKQLYKELVTLGYRGSYDRVCVFARRWRWAQQKAQQQASQGVYIPLVFNPGEAFQFDWSEEWLVIGGERRKVQLAHVKLCYSRAFVVRAYPLQTHEMLFDAHNHGFRVLGGVARRGIYDNMKTAVDRVKRGKAREVNARFSALLSHYLFEADFCNPASGWEKGQVEKQVRDNRHRLWHEVPAFVSLEALNAWLERRCVERWSTLSHPEHRMQTIAELWREEQSQLLAFSRPFDGFLEVPNWSPLNATATAYGPLTPTVWSVYTSIPSDCL